jgi:Ca-activated chloride channel homolog
MRLSQLSLSVLLRPVSAALVCVALCTTSVMTTVHIPAAKAIGVSGAGGDVANCGEVGFLVAIAGAAKKELGRCPLKHTDVTAEVSGFVSRVTVKQQFHNPFNEKIEAVYTFPLPENAAVDDMTMRIGNRIIKGSIKKREEAQEIYNAAKSRGHVASLLDQERPNIFTQSVANIEPGQNIDIEIKYVNVLKYDAGSFTFSFPTVVGPRFIPGTDFGHSRMVAGRDPVSVPDAARISPPIAPEGERAGHDISIALNINSPVSIDGISSKLHQVDVTRQGTKQARIRLKPSERIPNRDFVVTWDVASDEVRSGCLAHGDEKGGFFSLVLIPPKRVTPQTAAPKEMVFVIDCSGSQSGRPIEKAKQTMNYILDHMNPNDTFQIISFNNTATVFAPKPELASAAMKERAHSFVDSLQAHGGTWMAPAVEAACSLPNSENRLRIVTFMTDGFVGNDFEIISMIKKYRGTSRWFSFGTGNSVNRFLIDKIASEGGGEAEYVLLNSSAEEVGKKFYDRISSPVLTDIKVQFSGLDVKEVFPKDLSDLWAQKPLCLTGRYLKPGSGKAILTGYSGGKPYKQEVPISIAQKQPENAVLKSIWARAKVDRLMSEDWLGLQSGQPHPELKDEIIATALKYHIMTQFTSFVAVEEDRSTAGGTAKRIVVPVEMPQGVQMDPRSIQPLKRLHSTSYLHSYGSPAPVSIQSASAYSASASARSGPLPPTNMGKFVHLPGHRYSSAPGSANANAGAAMGMALGSYTTVPYRSNARHFERSGMSDSSFADSSSDQLREYSAGSHSDAPTAWGYPHNPAFEQKNVASATWQKSPVHEVIDADLRTLILQLESSSRATGLESLRAKKQLAELIRVRITLKSKSQNLLDAIKAAGLKLEKMEGAVLIGIVSLQEVSFIARMDGVARIERDVRR